MDKVKVSGGHYGMSSSCGGSPSKDQTSARQIGMMNNESLLVNRDALHRLPRVDRDRQVML